MRPSQNWHKWLMWTLLGLALSAQPIGCDYSSITEKFGTEAVARCNEKCPFQNRTDDGHFDLSCGSECSIQQCTLGCSLWKQGLEHTCQSACNVTSEAVVSRELYCVMGCNEALNTYFQKLRELLGTPAAPALVADSLTATSLSLLWEPPELGGLGHLLQWRYEELPGTWQYYANGSRADRDDSPVIHVHKLRPYTKYRFRVAIMVSGLSGSSGAAVEPIYSAASVVMSTQESGPPGSGVSALRAAAPDHGRVAISWSPGPFPNGPLVSYVLRLADTTPNAYAALEDMPASNNTLFYMFQNLSPAREYEVSVSMRNAVGEGPRTTVTVSTPPLPPVVPSQQPILILGGEQNILAAQANDMLSDPIELYSTEYNITGVGLDVSRDFLFVSVSNGFVYRSSLSKKSQSTLILTSDTISYKPLDLSVDWLNQHLYVLGEVYYAKEGSQASNTTLYSNWEILRCDFDGKNQLVAVAGFNSRPIHFEVDPYNGYIFWALRGAARGGLYRLDMAAVGNGARHEMAPERIVRDAHLAAFTLDHADFRLLLANTRHNTVLAVSLDGREINDLRRNTQTPMFGSARSIAFAGGLFYWTNGKEMLTEEYHERTDSYFHNEYPVVFNTRKVATRQVLVALRSCQPVPVPVNPPINVQGVMGVDKAKVSWSAPHLLGHQGIGAWQRWAFHLQLIDVATGTSIDRKGINGSTYIVENLKEDSEYVIKVAAATESGSGPWSSEFVGKTLASTPSTLQSTLLWSGPDGLLQTDLVGENLQTLIHRAHLKYLLITDISWYRDKLYLVTNASTVLWYNTTSHEKGLMPNMDNVGSLAVDWVGKRLYWSNPKQQLITRSNLEGGNREPVPIVTVAKELTIDSLGAYIYWSTGHAVESARLNGENKMVYYPAQLFSGKQVMGLTADLEDKWLYWLVRSYDGSELHRAPTADRIIQDDNEVSRSLVSRLAGPSSLGPLRYFSARLVWVRDAAQAVVSDLTGRYTAELVARVHALAVRDPTLHARSESLIAIPEAINRSSIIVQGAWDKFNVTWAPAANVNHGRVYYDVSLQFPGQYKIETTSERWWVEVRSRRVAPHSVVEVTVRAHTQWGSGAPVSAARTTPQAAPHAPAAPRLYVQREDPWPTREEEGTTAIFRWEPPSRPNGVIRGFETQCWVSGASPSALSTTPPPAPPASCAGKRLPPSHKQLIVNNIMPNITYYFQVRAFTDAGFGFYSEVVSASSKEINPIPRILMSSHEFIKVIDLDNGESETVPKIIATPVDFGVSIHENIIYWANNLEEIFSSQIIGSGHYKVSTLNGTARAVSVQWWSRAVYWWQREGGAHTHALYRAALPPPPARARPRRLCTRTVPRALHALQVAPLTRTLYWYEESEHLGFGTIMTSDTEGGSVRPFFNVTGERCNCPETPQVGPSFVLDATARERDRHRLYWVDPWVQRIVASDLNGCRCSVVVDTEQGRRFGFPPVSITVDSRNIYWFNSTENCVYYRDKNADTEVKQVKTSHGSKIVAMDAATQPYPPKHCLYPQATSLQPQMITNSANSITLEMPEIKQSKHCSNLETALTEYTIYYQLQSPTGTNEPTLAVNTVDREVVLYNLLTFRNYSVHLEATNYYAKHFEIVPIKGSPVTVQTAAEAPTAARDVVATVLSPVLARVEWHAQPDLWYQLYWATNESHFHHKFQEHNTFPVSEGRAANMSHLSPNTSYVVWVRACSNYSKVYTDSKQISVHTYPQPAPLVLRDSSPRAVHVVWTPPSAYSLLKYKVEYSEVSVSGGAGGVGVAGGAWYPCSRSAGGVSGTNGTGGASGTGRTNGTVDIWSATQLRPRARYRFRLHLQYAAHAPPYHWPHDDRYTFETLGDVPEAPGALRVEAVDERVLRAWWSEPEHNGYPITQYRVWGKPSHRIYDGSENATKNVSEQFDQNIPDDIDDDFRTTVLREGLVLLHNGTDNYWLMSSEQLRALEAGGGGWRVCVQAGNARGWGALSARAELRVPRERARAHHTAAALLVALAAGAAGAFLAALGLLYVYKNRLKKKAAMQTRPPINVTRRGPDVELATLRQLPIRHSTNILYNQGAPSPSDAEVSELPHIRREQITLTKFLGSGAFGEVFQGVARDLNGQTDNTNVAVKTLRKGATEQEKTEFLQEAALMANFKHEHILRLLGVCLDNDPHYIVMELMEAGDLLSYLRAKRASLYTRDSLTLLDLLSVCCDVTRGCRYLEEMHFVHRDLAARNCLVAQRGDRRLVKIGDFGLARDIYRNDYYRKEGEGLLPVRWMAVECLVDGVFSCQSDVWAWGVLCWEVLSLGQQPYPARTNRHVLAYVRAGGTPDRPPNCPSAFYELLQKCWSYSPERRPSFKQCLEVVSELREKTSPNITLTASCQPPHYLALIPDDVAVDNRTYLLDENDNTCLDEDVADHELEPSRLLPERAPKYLELMYSRGSWCAGDGYEIPRSASARHSVVGIAPRTLLHAPPLRSHSLRLRAPLPHPPHRPPHATVTPLRRLPPGSRRSLDDEYLNSHVFKTPF